MSQILPLPRTMDHGEIVKLPAAEVKDRSRSEGKRRRKEKPPPVSDGGARQAWKIGYDVATNMWETIFRYHGIDWIALALNSASIYLLGKKRKAGFSLGIVANLAWIVFAILAHSVATLVACTIFILLNVKGWWNWKHEETSIKQGR